MSTSFLYHAFNLKGVKYNSVEYIGNSIIFYGNMTNVLARCPECDSDNVIYKGQKTRDLLLCRCARKMLHLKLTVHRLYCHDCKNLRWPHLPFAPGKQRHTNSFAAFALDLLQYQPILAVAQFLGVGWDMIKTIHKNKLKSQYRHIDIRAVRYVAIDEFSIKKGHEYMTIAIDIETGRILHAAEGKGQAAIRPLLKKLRKKGKSLKAIAMDMSPAFVGAVLDYLPDIDIVFDRYHVSALANNALDDLRRAQQRALEADEKKTLKGSRYLLLSNYAQLHPDRKARVDELLRVNEPLFIMHSMKEQLRLFWDLPNKTEAAAFLKIWCDDAIKSGIQQLMKLGKTLAGYRPFLLNYFKHQISSGKIEGINNKIKTLKRQAYGFRDMEYFKLRLFHLHNQRYSLSG